MDTKVGPILMGVAYLALVVFLIVFIATETATFDDYSKYWGLFGTLVGVATGAIPSFFFKTQADRAADLAEKNAERAQDESAKAEAYASVADPDKAAALRASNPTLFR